MNDVYINARFLTQKTTGVQRFASEISKRLKKLDGNIKFLAPKNIINTELAEELGVIQVGKFSGHLWEQLELPHYLNKKGSPLLINLANTAPLRFNNIIATVHDVSFLLFPKAYSKLFYYYYRFLIPRIARKSKKIITVSEGSKNLLISYLNVAAEKVVVINNSSSHFSFSQNGNSPISEYGKYILSVASFNPLKNQAGLIEAFNKVKNKDIKLVIVGEGGKSFNDLDLNPQSGNIIFTGHINSLEKLSELYRNAVAFVFPSKYESFGIPTIEAMHCGCPVITSEKGSLREVCGDAAVYIDPYDLNSITQAIDLLIENQDLRQDLIIKGYEQSKKYNWDDSAQKLFDLIKTMKNR